MKHTFKPNETINVNKITAKILIAITLFFFVYKSSSAIAQNLEPNIKYTNVKIYLPKDNTQRLDLIGLLEIDHYHEHEGALSYTVDQRQLQLLKASGTKYEIVNDDAVGYLYEENLKSEKGINNNNARVAYEQTNEVVDNIIKTPTDFILQPAANMGGYYTFAQMEAAIDVIISKYGSGANPIAQKFSIGKTTENRDMWCVKISDNPSVDENEPEILFMGHHHAREAIGGASMIFLMQYLCEYYSKDNRIKDLVDNREIFIIVCANPDGWERNRVIAPTGGAQWRKNMRVQGTGITQRGVDLNRNWGVSWADCAGAVGASSCGSNTITSETYWGPSQYSEPETRNLRLFCRSHNFGAIMDQHSVGPYYSLPWGRQYNAMNAIDDGVYIQMASVMGKYNGMRYGSTFQTLGYEVSGGMKDVLLRGNDSLPNGKCYGMTGEGSNGTSGTSFWPLRAEIIKLCKGMVYQDLQLIYTVGSYVDLQDSTDINIQAKTGKLYFNLRRIGLQSQPIKVTAIPLENMSSVGIYKTVSSASLPNFNSIYKDSIAYTLSPSIASGNSFKYVWKVETAGYTYYDTITAIYKPNVLFTDNMETSIATTNWIINSGWAYTNDAAYRGAKSLSESPGNAVYADGVNLIAQKKTNLNLSGAGAAYLTFWVKYRAENFRDLLRVEVSTNGTSWVAISGKNTVREGGNGDGNQVKDTAALTGLNKYWSREVFDLKAYLGQTDLRLRFRFKSDPGGTTYLYDNDAGFNIDDVTIITGSTPTVLPVELINFIGYNVVNKNILNWTTASELNTKNFLIERTVDGRSYEIVGSVNAAGNSRTTISYSFIDERPYLGENIYRLRMVDLDDSYKYSKLVSIQLKNESIGLTRTGITKVYPNPTTENVSVEFQLNEEDSDHNVRVYNLYGQLMYNENISMITGEQKIELNTINYASGQYIITINNLLKGISYEYKFIRK